MPHIEEDLLDQYAMGTLPVKSIQEVEEHLLICEACQMRLAQTDEFLTVFSAAAGQPDAYPLPAWKRIIPFRTGTWAVAAASAGLAVFLVLGHRKEMPAPAATVLMQSFRGAESETHIASGKPAVLVFDLPVEAPAGNYEIEIVDPVGNEMLRTRAGLRDGRLSGLVQRLAEGSYWVRVYRIEPTRELIAEFGLRAE